MITLQFDNHAEMVAWAHAVLQPLGATRRRSLRRDSIMWRVREYVETQGSAHWRDVVGAFPDEKPASIRACLSRLVTRGDLYRPARGTYAPATTDDTEEGT